MKDKYDNKIPNKNLIRAAKRTDHSTEEIRKFIEAGANPELILNYLVKHSSPEKKDITETLDYILKNCVLSQESLDNALKTTKGLFYNNWYCAEKLIKAGANPEIILSQALKCYKTDLYKYYVDFSSNPPSKINNPYNIIFFLNDKNELMFKNNNNETYKCPTEETLYKDIKDYLINRRNAELKDRFEDHRFYLSKETDPDKITFSNNSEKTIILFKNSEKKLMYKISSSDKIFEYESTEPKYEYICSEIEKIRNNSEYKRISYNSFIEGNNYSKSMSTNLKHHHRSYEITSGSPNDLKSKLLLSDFVHSKTSDIQVDYSNHTLDLILRNHKNGTRRLSISAIKKAFKAANNLDHFDTDGEDARSVCTKKLIQAGAHLKLSPIERKYSTLEHMTFISSSDNEINNYINNDYKLLREKEYNDISNNIRNIDPNNCQAIAESIIRFALCDAYRSLDLLKSLGTSDKGIIISNDMKEVLNYLPVHDSITILYELSKIVPKELMNEAFSKNTAWKKILNFDNKIEQELINCVKKHEAWSLEKDDTLPSEITEASAEKMVQYAKESRLNIGTSDEIELELFSIINTPDLKKKIIDEYSKTPSWVEKFIKSVEEAIKSVFAQKKESDKCELSQTTSRIISTTESGKNSTSTTSNLEKYINNKRINNVTQNFI